MSEMIEVGLPDGSTRAVEAGATAGDLAAGIGRGLAKAAVIADINGEERDLATPLADGDQVAIVTADSERGRYTIRHSTAHVLAQAVLELFPGATFAIGPPIENGFYYDFELADGGTFTPEDLERLDAKMREIIAERQPFLRDEIPEADALEVFKDHKYKCEIIRGAADDPTSATEAGLVRTYENPPRFIDLCQAPRARHQLAPRSLQAHEGGGFTGAATSANPDAPAHLRTAWESKAKLDEYLTMLEEAEKRDHRRLAQELDLPSFPRKPGAGLAVWHPKGPSCASDGGLQPRKRHERGGVFTQFAHSPHVAKSVLWETSAATHPYARHVPAHGAGRGRLPAPGSP
ncbi:MAG: TGS domain-containing protein [Microthrixaceae bacterium]|nr:TGS domain-containing protein [Microthrixaceae bacterium]